MSWYKTKMCKCCGPQPHYETSRKVGIGFFIKVWACTNCGKDLGYDDE